MPLPKPAQIDYLPCMLPSEIPLSLTFDDVLLLPARTHFLPQEADLSTLLTRNLSLGVPLLSAAMDTVTESQTAITMAQEGGIGIVHKNMSPERQALEVLKVKKHESGMVIDPVTIHPEAPLSAAISLMKTHGISGIPVVKASKVVGILTTRDVRFESRLERSVSEVMTTKLVTALEGVSQEEAIELMHRHRIEKLLVVNETDEMKGLITLKDIGRWKTYPDRTSVV
jgi:IMP dehydrogenase